MRKLHILWSNFIDDHKGVTAIEYAVLAGAVAAIVGAVFARNGAFAKAFTKALTGLF